MVNVKQNTQKRIEYMYNAYVVEIREIEPHWGDRPDGFIIARSKEDIESFVKKTDCFKWSNTSDYCVENSDRVQCEVSQETLNEIESSNEKILWIHNKDFKTKILKHK